MIKDLSHLLNKYQRPQNKIDLMGKNSIYVQLTRTISYKCIFIIRIDRIAYKCHKYENTDYWYNHPNSEAKLFERIIYSNFDTILRCHVIKNLKKPEREKYVIVDRVSPYISVRPSMPSRLQKSEIFTLIQRNDAVQ